MGGAELLPNVRRSESKAGLHYLAPMLHGIRIMNEGTPRVNPGQLRSDGFSRRDCDEILESLSIIRLHRWLLQRSILDDTVDEATLIARLGSMEQQTDRINAILNEIAGLPAKGEK
jgi:hypothetical protein